jgi:threonine dehydrogenase-like Zn-dependent dehydrogenase
MTVRAVILAAPLQLPALQTFSDPVLNEGEVLLETIASEICGTDVHLYHGRLAETPYPIIPGHISVGRVRQIKGTVRDVEGELVQEGEIVTFLDVHGTCGKCWYCQIAKASTRCPERHVYGITDSAVDGLLGGWSEQIVLVAGVHIVKLPATVSPELFMAGGCALPTALHALQRAEVSFGDTVVVQGAGPVGLSATILAQLQGAGKVIVVGGPAHRLEIARALGADVTIDIDQHTPVERQQYIRELTGGRGADVTIEATGVPSAVTEGMHLTRDAGTLVVVGQYTDYGTTTINPHLDINKPHLQIRGTWGIDLSHFYRGMRVLARYGDKFPWTSMISHHYTMENVSEALLTAEKQTNIKSLILPNGVI